MSEESNRSNSNVIGSDLLKAISVCEERIRISKENEVRYHEVMSQRETAKELLDMTRETGNHMNKMFKNIKFFLENKKSSSKSVLEASIHSVSTIVKDADLQNCTILHEDGKTKILNERGQNINKREGSAARATMGILLRYTCLKALPNKIQIMFLDEALATLSSSTSVALRKLIEVIIDSIGIVGIEQKDILYKGLATKKYVAVKTGKVSVIKEED